MERKNLRRTCLFRTSLTDFTDSEYLELKDELLPVSDRFYFDLLFPLPADKNLVGILGREAVHIFNKVEYKWVESHANLGYHRFM